MKIRPAVISITRAVSAMLATLTFAGAAIAQSGPAIDFGYYKVTGVSTGAVVNHIDEVKCYTNLYRGERTDYAPTDLWQVNLREDLARAAAETCR